MVQVPEYKVTTFYSGTKVGSGSLCVHCFYYFWSNPLLSSCFKMASDRGWEGVTMFTSTYRILKVWTQNHFVPVPRHWFPGSKCGQPLRITFRANVNLYNMTECSPYWSFANHHVYTKKVVSFITFILDSLSSHFFFLRNCQHESEFCHERDSKSLFIFVLDRT